MSNRTLRRRMLAGGILLASFAAACTAPLSAQAGTGKCMWYDADIPPATGSPTVPFQDCGLHSAQTPEATYYWSDESRVIIEPRALAFDYSAYGGLDPFATEYSVRKANELFPDTSHLTDAYAKAAYAQKAMTAKARMLDARRGLTTKDGCNFVPAVASDLEISHGDALLPPSPTPNGTTGTYTYSLASNLTADQRAAVLAGLAAFAAAREGSRQPELVEWQSGDANPPVITFTDYPDGFEDHRYAETETVTWDVGRDGLDRFVNGNINLSRSASALTGWSVAHEILHVYGFQHTSFDSDEEAMAPSANGASTFTTFSSDSGYDAALQSKLDSCTKEGLSAAPAPK